MKLSNYKNKLFSAFFGFISEFTRERIKLSKRFGYHSMYFQSMHIMSKFHCFIHILTVVKRKHKNQTFLRGGKSACFCNFFNVAYLNKLMSYKLNICFKLLLIILIITYIKILRLLQLLMCQNAKRVRSSSRQLSITDCFRLFQSI